MGQRGVVVCALALVFGPACGGNNTNLVDASSIDAGGDANVAFDAASCVPAPAGLTGRWRGEGNTKDSLGAYDGVAQGGLTYGTGRFGMAFHFDGTDAAVSIDDGDALWPTGSFTVVAWVKPPNSGKYEAIVGKNECGGATCPTGTSAHVELYIEDGGFPYLRVRTSETGAAYHSAVYGTAINDDQWHMVAGVRDVTGGNLLVYVDDKAPGMQAITGEALLPLKNTDGEIDPMLIGANTGDNGTKLVDLSSALIDEVAVFDRALTQQELATLYATVGGICP